MSVPADQNISLKEFEKLSKYENVEVWIGRMWKPKKKNLPVAVGALRLVKKMFA